MSKFNYANEIYNINSQAPKALDMTAVSDIPNAFLEGYQTGQNIKNNKLKQELMEDEIALQKQENELRRQYLNNPNENRQYEPYFGIKSSMPGTNQSVAQFGSLGQQNATLFQNPIPVQPLNNTSLGANVTSPFQNNLSVPTNNTINGIGYVSPNRTDAYNFPSVLDAGLTNSANNFSMMSSQKNNTSLENMTVNLSEPDRGYNALLMGDMGELNQAQSYARLLDDNKNYSGSSLWSLF